MDETDQLAAIVRGAARPTELTGEPWRALRRTAEHHRVLPLVAARLLATPEIPAAVTRELLDHSRRAVITEAVRETELVGLLNALEDASAGALLFKGAALAYTYYDRPEWRPRTDTDLLVSEDGRAPADAVLRQLGYAPAGGFSGDLVAYQAMYLKRREDAVLHVVDLHWRLANPQPFGNVLLYEEAAAEAVSIPTLGSGARALSPVHALLVACVHRVAHHGGDQRLIWLVDIGRIAHGLTKADWARFVGLAVDRRVSAVCRDGLEEAARVCRIEVPGEVIAALTEGRDGQEPTAAFLGRRRHAAVVAQDLTYLPTWSSRASLLRQHVFPPAAYMREAYAPGSRLPLFVLYLKRVWNGARKWLARA